MEPMSIPRSKPLALTGVLFLTAPLFGAVTTVIGMIKAFGVLQVKGAADPEALAGDISIALISTLYGLILGTIGIILVAISLFRNHNREQWFYQSVIILSVIWCILLFPIGLIPGILMYHHFHKRRKEFSA